MSLFYVIIVLGDFMNQYFDNNEKLEFYYVDKRIIDGTKNDYVFVVVHKIEEIKIWKGLIY